MKTLAVLLATACLALPVGAAEKRSTTVFRCGPDGRQLSDRPCPAEPGASQTLSYTQPSPAETAAARRQAASDARTAKALQKERERFEALPRAAAAGIGPSSQAASAPQDQKAAAKSKARKATGPAPKPAAKPASR